MARFSRLVSPAAVLLGTSIFGNFAAGTEPGKEIAAPTAPLTTSEPKVQLPTFAFQTVTTTVCVPDGGTIVNGGKLYSTVPQVQRHVGADGLERIGIDFEITPRIIISEEEEDRLLGTATENAPAAPRTLAALIMAEGAEGVRRFFGIQSTPAEVAASTAEHITAVSAPEAQPEKPFALDKIQLLEMEITPLQEAGVVAKDGPVLRMSALTQERMLRHFATAANDSAACPAEKMAEKCQPGIICIHPDAVPAEQDYEFPDIKSWQQLSTNCQQNAKRLDAPAANPLPESGIEPISDDFVQHLPPRDDVPLENPPAIAASRAVSPTMSPLEYAETFLTQDERNNLPVGTEMLLSEHNALTGRICSFSFFSDPIIRSMNREGSPQHDAQVQQTAYDEPSAPADAFAFDGPAQITLQDGPGKSANGFAWPAQPAAQTESLDELAERLEREFLQRAVSGQIQSPSACFAACPAVDKEAACQAAAACKSGSCQPCQPTPNACQPATSVCQSDKCQPSQCGLADCPGCPAGSPCSVFCQASGAMPSGAPMMTFPAAPRSQWTLPTPAVTFNPYAQTSPIAGPGAGTVLPRDCDFFMRSPMEIPAGPSICGPQVCTGPSTFAPAQPPMTVPHPQMAMGQQQPRMEWTPAINSPAPANSRTPANHYGAAPTPMRTPISGEALETYRDISRTLGQMAERCEAQGLYERADELRDMAQEYRMSARVVHGHLSAMPLPQPVYGQMPAYGPMSPTAYGQMPMPYAVPSMYIPDQAPSLAPPIAPATYPQPQHQPLPIAQPMLSPRY